MDVGDCGSGCQCEVGPSGDIFRMVSWLNYTGKETLYVGALDRREFGIEKAVGVSALDNLQ